MNRRAKGFTSHYRPISTYELAKRAACASQGSHVGRPNTPPRTRPFFSTQSSGGRALWMQWGMMGQHNQKRPAKQPNSSPTPLSHTSDFYTQIWVQLWKSLRIMNQRRSCLNFRGESWPHLFNKRTMPSKATQLTNNPPNPCLHTQIWVQLWIHLSTINQRRSCFEDSNSTGEPPPFLLANYSLRLTEQLNFLPISQFVPSILKFWSSCEVWMSLNKKKKCKNKTQ